jgi:transcriptional regulator with XRE-family HTH domain
MNYLARNIAHLRKVNKVTQAEIQASIGFKPNTQSNWENEVSEPSIEIIIQYSEYFKVNLADLILKDLSKETEEGGTYEHVQSGHHTAFAAEPEIDYNSSNRSQQQIIDKMQQIIDAQLATIKALQSALVHAEKRLNNV